MQDKILFIGHYEEASGWGEAARNYILAMNSVGLNVVPRSVRPNKAAPKVKLPPIIEKLEQKEVEGCNICVQHLLPHLMDYNGRFDRNIGLFVTETMNWWYSGWHDYVNQMDEAWVPNHFMKDTAKENRVKIPVNVVPHACDTQKYDRIYQKMDIEPVRGNFTFYFIGEYNRRKRISALIQAFFLEFTRNEPVSLVLKVNKHGVDPRAIYEDILKIVGDIKQSHKLSHNDSFPNIVIIPGYMSDEEICKLHTTCDCFVNPSFGEAWSIPTFDAMGFNKLAISSDFGGPSDFLSEYNGGYLVGGEMVPVFGMTETFPQLNSAREQWYNIDIQELAKAMREQYNVQTLPNRNGRHLVEKYSYRAVGTIIKNLLTKQ